VAEEQGDAGGLTEDGPEPLALVTGATGYIGGRLVPELLAAGYRVRCLARDPSRLRGRAWSDQVEVARGDLDDPASVRAALDGVEVAYYLVHSLASEDFVDRDRRGAETFAIEAQRAGIRRIVYLGGPQPREERVSPHLASRLEVGRILLGSGVPTAVLRAAVIIGSGSASFEMLRHLTERLPAMVVPRWASNRIQPIAIRDVLRYLVAAASLPPEVSREFDIAGPDVLTYADMMKRYAAVARLPKRLIIQVPVLTPGLSAHWVGAITPVPSSIARPLVESLRNEALAHEHDIAAYIPDPPGGLVGFERAVELALKRVKEADVATRWSSASTPGAPSDPLPSDPDWAGGSLYEDARQAAVDAPAEALWRIIEGIGGDRGYYSLPWAWELRGLADRAVGGVGLRRGRRDPDRVMVGDALDFWRVEERVPCELLRLRAEMRLPGLAWLEFGVAPDGPSRSTYRQRAVFAPHGFLGHVYWWAVAPFHGVVFGSMVRNIGAAAEALARAEAAEASRAGARPETLAG
jgi:uncharacterized protein YbjT (DUF2867 family)